MYNYFYGTLTFSYAWQHVNVISFGGSHASDRYCIKFWSIGLRVSNDEYDDTGIRPF